MLTTFLNYTKRWLYQNPLRKPLDALAITAAGRRLLNRNLKKQGIYELSILNTELKLVADSDQLISEIETASREDAFITRLLDCLNPDDVFFDVGANIGIISMVVAGKLPESSIHAFEPEPRNAAILRANLKHNGLDQVVTRECAVGSRAGTVKLFVAEEAGAGTHTTVPASGRAAIDVPVVTLDEEVRRSGIVPTVIKIDVEGAELDVLRGMQGTLGSGVVREMFIEVHPAQLSQQHETAESVGDFLKPLGMYLAHSDRRDHEYHQHFVRGETAAAKVSRVA